MRAMILAAGVGQRMGSLTAKTPKPLLKVAGRYLIEYTIETLCNAGIYDIVINVSYRKEQIMDALGTGARYGVRLYYSEEVERLETGGGVVKALPLLGDEPFIILSADIISDYPLKRLAQRPLKLAHLVMVANPPYNLKGDYSLKENQELYVGQSNSLTFANIGIYRPALFAGHQPVFCRLAHLWQAAMAAGQVTGECYSGLWYNVGTPQELNTAEKVFSRPIFRAREDSNL